MYPVDHFYHKFNEIPESKWHVGAIQGPRNSYCALGHCRDEQEQLLLRRLFYKYFAEISLAVNKKYTYGVAALNDDVENKCGFGTHPKERILNALLNIKYASEDSLPLAGEEE